MFLDEFAAVVVGAGMRVLGEVFVGEVVGLVPEEERGAVLSE